MLGVNYNISCLDVDSPVVSDDAFDWLKEAYGQNAAYGPVCDDYRRAAIYGCIYAYNNMKCQLEVRICDICIYIIEGHVLHTVSETVAYAACYATWLLLGVKPPVAAEDLHFSLPAP